MCGLIQETLLLYQVIKAEIRTLPSKGLTKGKPDYHDCCHLRVRPSDSNRGRVAILGPLPPRGLHKHKELSHQTKSELKTHLTLTFLFCILGKGQKRCWKNLSDWLF